jgi:hypothetical protein
MSVYQFANRESIKIDKQKQKRSIKYCTDQAKKKYTRFQTNPVVVAGGDEFTPLVCGHTTTHSFLLVEELNTFCQVDFVASTKWTTTKIKKQ